MKTIEDLKIEQTFYKREKDIYGNVTRTPYKKMVPRTPIVVGTGVRFGYYLIDVVFLYIFNFILGVILVVTNLYSPTLEVTIITNVLSYVIWFMYYSVFESFFKGSLGKLITGYTVIDEYAQSISFPKAMLRTVCRLVPFEAFSCFSERGWHDKWSKTYVVKKSEQIELQRLLGNLNQYNDILD